MLTPPAAKRRDATNIGLTDSAEGATGISTEEIITKRIIIAETTNSEIVVRYNHTHPSSGPTNS